MYLFYFIKDLSLSSCFIG